MTAACLPSRPSAVRLCEGRSVDGGVRKKKKKKKKHQRFVYLRCIPTVVQAAEREMERRERMEGGREGAAALKKMMRRLFLEAAD